MDLKDFIAQTLSQIIEGVQMAQLQTKGLGAEINPTFRMSASSEIMKQGAGFDTSSAKHAQLVKIDVALTVTEGTGTKAGIGVLGGVISLGASGQSSAENSSVSRVTFQVPVVLPQGK